MADVINRLKLESGEFDSKIKRAAQGIQRMAEECHKAGAMLNVMEDENRKYIQSIGQMETVNKTARGSVSELTAAFMDMKHVYNELSEEEKKGEVGRELNKQLAELKRRINEGNQEIRDMQQELNGGFGGALDSITAKFGVSIKQVASFGTIIGAGTVALDVAKDAFFANEMQLDEWGRIVQSSESLYNGFLNALNTGDIGGFLNSIDEIVNSARDAYDALDQLSTFNAFTRGSRAGLRSNYSEALNEYKLNPTAENKKRLADANKALVEGMQQQADKMKYAYEKSLNGLGVERLLKGQRLEEFKNLFRSGNYEELERIKGGYSQGKMMNAGSQYWYGDRVYDGKIQDRSTGKWRVMEEDERKQFEFARVLAQVNDKQIDSIQALDEQYKNTLDAINNQNRSYNRLSGNNGRIRPRRAGGTHTPKQQGPTMADQANLWLIMTSGADKLKETDDRYFQSVHGLLGDKGANQAIGSIAPELSADIEKQIALVDELRQKWADTKGEISDGYLAQLLAAEDKLSMLKESQSISTSDGRKPFDLGRNISTQWQIDKKGQLVQKKGKGDEKEKDKEKTAVGQLQILNQGVSGMLSGIEKMGIELPEGFKSVVSGISGMLSVLESINTIVVAIQGLQEVGTFLGIFARGGIVPHAANGYYVPGTHMSGDVTPIMANAGELVLNKAAQGNLASILSGQGGALQNLHLTASVHGEQIVLAVNNTMKRKNKGELATFR